MYSSFLKYPKLGPFGFIIINLNSLMMMVIQYLAEEGLMITRICDKAFYYKLIFSTGKVTKCVSLAHFRTDRGTYSKRRSFRARKIFSNVFGKRVYQGKNAKANTDFSSIIIFWLKVLFLNQFIIK